MSIQDEINRTKSRIGDLLAEIRRLETHGNALVMQSWGLKVGDIIRVKSPRNGEFLASVTGVRSWAGLPTPLAVRLKVNGDVGATSAGYIEKWEKVEPPK